MLSRANDSAPLAEIRDLSVRFVSREATVHAVNGVSFAVRPGEVFMPMHYPETNQLTLAVFDPYSRQPAYTACAGAIRPAPAAEAS